MAGALQQSVGGLPRDLLSVLSASLSLVVLAAQHLLLSASYFLLLLRRKHALRKGMNSFALRPGGLMLPFLRAACI